jgi:hypothetical protein
MHGKSVSIVEIIVVRAWQQTGRSISKWDGWVGGGKISYAITYPGANMQSSDLVHPI